MQNSRVQSDSDHSVCGIGSVVISDGDVISTSLRGEIPSNVDEQMDVGREFSLLRRSK